METMRDKPVLAFDVYGTLIDPFQMEEHIRVVFGSVAKEATELWRNKQLEYSFRRAVMKKYQNFNACTEQALHFVCAQFGVSPAKETLRDLLDRYLELPVYPDVPGALAELETR